jgi:hypothetical protein
MAKIMQQDAVLTCLDAHTVHGHTMHCQQEVWTDLQAVGIATACAASAAATQRECLQLPCSVVQRSCAWGSLKFCAVSTSASHSCCCCLLHVPSVVLPPAACAAVCRAAPAALLALLPCCTCCPCCPLLCCCRSPLAWCVTCSGCWHRPTARSGLCPGCCWRT